MVTERSSIIMKSGVAFNLLKTRNNRVPCCECQYDDTHIQGELRSIYGQQGKEDGVRFTGAAVFKSKGASCRLLERVEGSSTQGGVVTMPKNALDVEETGIDAERGRERERMRGREKARERYPRALKIGLGCVQPIQGCFKKSVGAKRAGAGNGSQVYGASLILT